MPDTPFSSIDPWTRSACEATGASRPGDDEVRRLAAAPAAGAAGRSRGSEKRRKAVGLIDRGTGHALDTAAGRTNIGGQGAAMHPSAPADPNKQGGRP